MRTMTVFGVSCNTIGPPMDIRIDKQSDVPVHRQVADQIVFLIVTEKLKAGAALPSVRELARRLNIHHNTVSQAYQRLVQEDWLIRRHGSRLVVGPNRSSGSIESAQDLDELINAAIRMARAKGHSLQAVRQRVRERLLDQAPDHILVVEQDAGLRTLMEDEIRGVMDFPVQGCSREELAAHSGLAIGALAVAAQHAIAQVDALVPKNRPAIALRFASADKHIELIRSLRAPSVIGVASISEAFMQIARSLLAPALGQRHSLKEFFLSSSGRVDTKGVDVMFADSTACRLIRIPKATRYQLVAEESLEYLSNAIRDSRQAADSPAALGRAKKKVAP